MTGVILGHVTPQPKDPKHERLVPLRAECEVLVVGPSYAKQVYEEEFEAEATRRGRPIHLCKFAKNRLGGFEQHLELQSLLAGQHWPRLKLVLFDATLGPASGYVPENSFKPRVRAYHTAGLFPWYFRYWKAQHNGLPAHAKQLTGHLLHYLGNILGVGRGSPGIESLAEPHAPPRRQRQMTRGEHEAKVAHLKRARRKDVPHAMLRKQQIIEEAELIRAQGYRGEALVAPTWVHANAAGKGHVGAARVPIHDFADPERYPSLYKYGTHKRDGHLTRSGAEEYSKLLARVVVERLEASK
jgi:hypothetical protein